MQIEYSGHRLLQQNGIFRWYNFQRVQIALDLRQDTLFPPTSSPSVTVLEELLGLRRILPQMTFQVCSF